MKRRLSLIFFLAGLAGAGLFTFQRYLDNPASEINRFVPPSWGTKARLATLGATFPESLAVNLPEGRPPVDLRVPQQTETALFALG